MTLNWRQEKWNSLPRARLSSAARGKRWKLPVLREWRTGLALFSQGGMVIFYLTFSHPGGKKHSR
jgi:hypothetical protein